METWLLKKEHPLFLWLAGISLTPIASPLSHSNQGQECSGLTMSPVTST